MRDQIQARAPERTDGRLEFEGDLRIEGPQGCWIVTGHGGSFHVEMPSWLAGWRLARNRQTVSWSQRCLGTLEAELTIWLRGAAICRMGPRVSGNLWGRLAGLNGTEMKLGGLLSVLLSRFFRRQAYIKSEGN